MPNPQPSPDDVLLSVALAIADGHPVDWSSLGGSASADVHISTSGSSGLLRVDQIVRGHREMLARGPVEAPLSQDTLLTATAREHAGIRGAFDVVWGPLIVVDIGRGTFGDVYRARDPRLDRDVALKLLRKDVPDQIGSPAVEEGRLLARVRHPNVVTVFGADRAAGRVGIWMELVRGHTLADEDPEAGATVAASRRRGRCAGLPRVGGGAFGLISYTGMSKRKTSCATRPGGSCSEISGPAFSSMSASSRRRHLLAHLSISRRKCSNTARLQLRVLVQRRGPALLPPERPASCGGQDTRRLCATGTLPAPPSRLRSLVAGIPKPLETIVEKLLAAAPDQRFGSALEVERALDGWLVGQPQQTQWRGDRNPGSPPRRLRSPSPQRAPM